MTPDELKALLQQALTDEVMDDQLKPFWFWHDLEWSDIWKLRDSLISAILKAYNTHPAAAAAEGEDQ